MFGLFEKELTTVKETSLSRFIREASSADKKRIYSEVLRKATDRQLKVLEEVSRDRHANASDKT
jgi:hypothetical protein